MTLAVGCYGRDLSMRLVVIHKNTSLAVKRDYSLFQRAASSKRIAEVIFSGLSANPCLDGGGDTMVVAPEEWYEGPLYRQFNVTYYNKHIPVGLSAAGKGKGQGWFVVSNGRFFTRVDRDQLSKTLAGFDAELIAVNVDPELLSYCEKVRVTSRGGVAGFRRLYYDLVLPSPMPTDWPHHIFVKLDVLDKVAANGALPPSFAEFVCRGRANSLGWRSVKIGGSVLDLETEAGLLSFLTTAVHLLNHYSHRGTNGCMISCGARLFGKVVLGDNVCIGDDAVIVGPTILGDDVKVAPGAIIRASVIGPGFSVPRGCYVQNRILVGPVSGHKLFPCREDKGMRHNYAKSVFVGDDFANNNFRIWPRLSYARGVKRVADVIFSLVVLILFAPVFLVVAIAIKLSSPGSVFFKHKREGLHGKKFFCLKFRTMICGADKIQEKLRFKNQVDGPQFKVKDDPRVTVVGRFLRNTFIDEIPQFINILLGQMSVVGPRPSPKSENSLCPEWRDARLSVRPGITGLWQVKRTRQAGRDFQEWIYYDTKYTKELSFWLDLWIFWRTAKKLVVNFIEQF